MMRILVAFVFALSLGAPPSAAAQPKNLFEALFPKLKERRLKRERAAKPIEVVRVSAPKVYDYKVAKRGTVKLSASPAVVTFVASDDAKRRRSVQGYAQTLGSSFLNDLAEAEAQGASLDEATQENDADVEVLEAAEFQQDNAVEFADASLESTEDGVYDADADMMDDYAADAADQADAYAEQGDQGGYYGDQSIHTDNV